MRTKEEEEIKKLIGNDCIIILGTFLATKANEQNEKSMAWNIIGGIGKDMSENPDKYRSIIEDILEAWNRANK